MSVPNSSRRNLGFIVAIVAGLALGFLIKKVHIGLLIGLAIGLLGSALVPRK